jgi:hypothetical protein
LRVAARADAGTVTAEAAVVLPVLALVTLLLAGLLALLSASIAADEAARSTARELARGGSMETVRQDLVRRWPGVEVDARSDAGLVFVEVRRPLEWPGLLGRVAPIREVVGAAAVAAEVR